jgi:hypothetical protein
MTLGCDLVGLHTTPSMFGRFWCMFGGSGGIRMKNILCQLILHWLIEGQTQFAMLRGAKMSLALNESK